MADATTSTTVRIDGQTLKLSNLGKVLYPAAGFTKGAVYSNFPGKRALYLAVLVDMVEGSAAGAVPRSSPPSAAAALGAFARVWLERLPLAGDTPAAGHLQLRSLAGVVDDEPARTVAVNLDISKEMLETKGIRPFAESDKYPRQDSNLRPSV